MLQVWEQRLSEIYFGFNLLIPSPVLREEACLGGNWKSSYLSIVEGEAGSKKKKKKPSLKGREASS